MQLPVPSVLLALLLAASGLLVVSPAANADHDLPPAVNGPIAFVLESDIWYLDPDGVPHRVTTGRVSPSWDLELSPDGKRIAFSIPNGSENELWVVNVDGTHARNVLAGSSQPYGEDPSWDPSGHRLVFHAYAAETSTYALFTVEVDDPGSVKRLTTFDIGGADAVPAWNPVPGSQEIAYIPCCDGRIRVIDAATGQERWLSGLDDPPAWNLDWSPDGTKLAVEAYTDGRLYTVNSDGTNWLKLDPNYTVSLTYPSWSPDGTMIAAQGLDSTKATSVVVIDAVKGVPGGVTSLTEDWGGHEFAPTWGPECVEQCIGTELTAKRKMRDRKIKVVGALEPDVAGQRVEVTLNKKKNGKWRPLATKTPTTNLKGAYATSFARPKSGRCGVLVEFHGSADHMPSYTAIPPFAC